MSHERIYGPTETEVAFVDLKEGLQGNFPTFSEYMKYEPLESWFRYRSGVHGINHAARSVVLGQLTGRLFSTDEEPVDLDEVSLTLLWHDNDREETIDDPSHGRRAADKIYRIIGEDKPSEHLARVLNNIALHDAPHAKIPADAWTPELQVVRYADALDRVRLDDAPIDDRYKIDPNRLYFREFGGFMIPIARELFRRTRDSEESYRNVGVEAMRMGIIIEG